jgi:hypothetical protein
MLCIGTSTGAPRGWRAAAVAVASAAWLLLPGAAVAQTRPAAQAQSGPAGGPAVSTPGTPSGVSDQQLNAAAKAIRQVATVRQSYARKIAAAPPNGKQQVAREANDALKKAVTDQGLSVDEYNSILQRAQTDKDFREKLVERIPPAQQ